jgi:formate dehydrogenase major subunit
VSLLKAWYDDHARKDNDFCFNLLPKLDRGKNYSYISLFEEMAKGKIEGMMVWGQNPAVSGPNLNMERNALENLSWLAVSDLWETETTDFWKRPGANPQSIKTEVFLLPACVSFEKEGSVTNSGRWSQWRYKAIDPPGEAKDDLWIMDKLMLKLKELYSRKGGPKQEAITKLTWDYGEPPDPHKVAKEINGYNLSSGKLMDSYFKLRDDGSTSSGNHLYSGSYTEEGNMAARRDPTDKSKIGLYSNWAWSWPQNQRILYNRASINAWGRPWDPTHPVAKWDLVQGKWLKESYDTVLVEKKGPGDLHSSVVSPDGVMHLFGLNCVDGPFPEFYEPWESPTINPMSAMQNNPCIKVWRAKERGRPNEYPIVATTFRLTEHWQAGQMTRNLPWLVELMPQMFVEIGEDLAREKGVRSGDRVKVSSARGGVRGIAIVTKRLKPLWVDGRIIHQIGVPWHWGYTGLSKGDSANLLTSHIGDANTMIPEYKTFLCNIERDG